MKFLKSEYDSVKNLIDEKGHDYSEFSFVKKRGTLNIIWAQKEEPFKFYRKKETVINENMQFEEKLTYFLGAQKEIAVDSWEEVLVRFSKYLG
ncbi:hypothetical protein JYT72_02850 [Crocinitomix catalasitica]|nr:hypothetical protein [Crocinitomix catalasitica]